MNNIEEIKNARVAEIKKDLEKYGIKGTTEVVYNPSYEQLFKEETLPSLEGYEKGVLTELNAVDVMTGVYTGRSPKDKFIVLDENSKTPSGGQLKNTKTTTNPPPKKHGRPARLSQSTSSPAKNFMLSTVSAAQTKTPAWLSASSSKWHGRLTS